MPKFHTVFQKFWKIEFFQPNFFQVTRISHMRIFDMTMLVRTVNGESLSEIAIHNFEKSRKIEIRIVPYGIFRYGHLGRRKWSR